jgi:hypothetical protein
MKIDLSKDLMTKSIGIFLRLVLLQYGLNLQSVNWIMGCLEYANFAVMINGSPSSILQGFFGDLGQGCPLSPFFFNSSRSFE